MDSQQDYPLLTARPYELLCLVCSLGDGDPPAKDARLEELLASIRSDPDLPLVLRCNAGDQFAYQDVGTEHDTPEGPEFNRKRDLDVLQRLDLTPGATMPARIALGRLLNAIPTVAGICGYDTVAAEAWRGCPLAKSGHYEKGHAKGIRALIPPRCQEEMEQDKVELDMAFQAKARLDELKRQRLQHQTDMDIQKYQATDLESQKVDVEKEKHKLETYKDAEAEVRQTQLDMMKAMAGVMSGKDAGGGGRNCVKCGRAVQEEFKVCPFCGHKLK